jgi:hypothetical protein
LIESLGSDNHNEKLVLYIPEKSLPASTTKGLRRNVSISGDRPTAAPSVSSPTTTSGSTEGFDRFASIRRSRRYKKEAETPATTNALTRSASLYSTVRSRNPRSETEKLNEPSKLKDLNGALNSDSSSASRTTKSTSRPELRVLSEELRSSRINSQPVIMSSNGTSIVQIRSPGNSYTGHRDSRSSSKAVLSSSPGTAERDEGFEESHSSLSETNSQTESHNIPAAVIVKPSDKKSSHRILGSSSFKLQSRPSMDYDVTTSINNNNNNNNNNSNKNSSRTSLISSKGSLTSQTTVGTVRENDPKKRSTSSSSSVRLPEPSKVFPQSVVMSSPIHGLSSSGGASSELDQSNNSLIMQQMNSKNHSVSSSFSGGGGGDKPKSNGKGFTPRILSFMRPTASSTAKDKVDSVKSSKGKGSKPSSFR